MDVAQRVISVIARFRKVPEESISLESSLEDFGLDSLDGLNLIFELEEEFNFMIPDDQATKMKTVGEIVANIEQLLASKASEGA